ncbi:MAG: CHAT domain-containing protein [Planctomycetales bacterium]|nr:CHAT domain-containing protein [Planctomycetales bacterium]MBN8624303.1 CHAT domain-containing protein [Planctomycetota bacterium]
MIRTTIRISRFIPWCMVAATAVFCSAAHAADESDNLLAERDRLWTQAQELRNEKKFVEAAAAGRAMLDIERKVLDADDESLPFSMSWMAEVLEAAERWDDAAGYRDEALAWHRKYYGDEHWRTSDADQAVRYLALVRKLPAGDRTRLIEARLSSEAGITARFEGRFDDARRDLEKAIEIRRRLLGDKHRLTLIPRYYFGLMISDQGDFATAHDLLQSVTSDALEAYGRKHPHYYSAVAALGSNAHLKGDYDLAEKLHREAISGRRELLGEHDGDYAFSLSCLAQVREARGDTVEAVRLYEQALAALGEAGEPGQRLIVANNLAGVLVVTGDYARAEPLYRECIKLAEQVYGTKHYQYAKILGNLAQLMKHTGDLAEAERLTNLCVDISKVAFGPRHPGYAIVLSNLSELHWMQGDSRAARRAAKEAVEILEETVGPKHPSLLLAANNLAMAYYDLEWYHLAEKSQRQVLELSTEVHGPRHPMTLMSLGNLANISSELGRRDEAQELFERCLKLRKEALGESHPDYHLALHNFACELAEVGEDERAASLFREAIRRTRDLVEQTAIVQSERQQLAMAQTLRYRLDVYVSLAARRPEFARNVFDEVLAWKGATLVRQRGMRLVADDPAVGELFKQLQEAARQLVAASRTSPEAEAAQVAWREQVAKLTAEKERLERDLSRLSGEFRQAVHDTTLDELLAAIPADAVLVDLLEYTRMIPAEVREESPDYEREFVAFVVRPTAEKADQVRVVPLGPAAPIIAAVDTWRESFGMSPEGMRAGAELRQTLWLPLEAALGDATTVLISTDGALGRLPIGALPGKEPGKFLLEAYRLATIPVPQLLPALIHDEGKREVEHELLLLGDVDYEAAPDGAKSPSTKKKRPLRPGEKSGNRAPAADAVFKPLANTAGEIASIGTLYGRLYEIAPDDPRSLAQAEATEANFRALSAKYRHLHLATHGFFAAAEHASALATSDEEQSRHRGGPIRRNAAIEGFNPGLLSGLALAGANREPTDKADDGILTSQEIAFLPLQGVDTVVLSACDTGLGDVAGGEGLLGVQRAFQVAGARTTVAGYWKVDDLVTRLLMERFYLNLWEKKLSRLDALREAQLYVLNHPEAIRGADVAEDEPIIRTSPRFWAAFGLSGDWR